MLDKQGKQDYIINKFNANTKQGENTMELKERKTVTHKKTGKQAQIIDFGTEQITIKYMKDGKWHGPFYDMKIENFKKNFKE